MKSHEITADKAWELGWWWRCLKVARFEPKSYSTVAYPRDAKVAVVKRRSNRISGFSFWKPIEESAWAYELTRRAYPEKELPPYYDLPEATAKALLSQLSSPTIIDKPAAITEHELRMLAAACRSGPPASRP